ncbi:MAG: glucosyl-3-phosphoglycerate synthase [Thermoleophilia bacterium]
MTPDEWLQHRTYPGTVDPQALLAAKAERAQRVSVIIPALEVADTVGEIVRRIRHHWMESCPLVDQLVVVDSHSADDTARVAADAGATVLQDDEVLPDLPPARGKGEAMWKSLHATDGDLVLWVDGDIVDFDPAYVPAMLNPLLTEPEVVFVKAAYGRMLDGRQDGGRVTEICARPLLNLVRRELSVVAQPLAGEQAGRRTHLERLPFLTGYAVEMGLLLDTHARTGLSGIAQVALPARSHVNQSTADLGRMAYAVSQAILTRSRHLEGFSRLPYRAPVPGSAGWRIDDRPVTIDERPPLTDLGTAP